MLRNVPGLTNNSECGKPIDCDSLIESLIFFSLACSNVANVFDMNVTIGKPKKSLIERRAVT